jgi:hypothetical protein
MIYSFILLNFGNCLMSNFTMELVRICSYFSNVDFLLYTSQNKEILLSF